MEESYVLFQVDNATYAVPSAEVQRIEMIEEITHVPNTLDFIDGVVFLRGQVVPVVNMRQRFGMEKIPYNLVSRLVVVNIDGRVIAMAVDSAREFVRLNDEEVVPPPDSLAGPGTEYLKGVIAADDRLLLMVDLKEMLTWREKEQLREQSFEEELQSED